MIFRIPTFIPLATALLLFSWGCATKGSHNVEAFEALPKIKGVSFVAPPNAIDASAITPVANIHANYMSVIPYSFCPSDSPALVFNSKYQWWGERTEGVIRTIELAREQQIKVMLKPQIWLRHGVYTGTLEYSTTEEWKQWEKDYRAYIMHFARIADSMKVAMYCIGTELSLSVKQRPEFWTELIQEVKQTYSGKLTYAANWDDYTDVPFWNELDLIGIDAYFPLSDEKKPELTAIKETWKNWTQTLSKEFKEHRKPVLFTEVGYRSAQFSLKEPWQVDRKAKLDLEAQANGYEALFETVWNEDWMAGIFLWKWFSNDEKITQDNNDFSPQNKPAEKVIKTYFSE